MTTIDLCVSKDLVKCYVSFDVIFKKIYADSFKPVNNFCKKVIGNI